MMDVNPTAGSAGGSANLAGAPALRGMAALSAGQKVLDLVERRRQALADRRTLFDTLGEKLARLDSLLQSLTSDGVGYRAAVSDPVVLHARLGPQAIPGRHTLEIRQIALPHLLGSIRLPADGTDLGGRSGSFRVTWGGGNTAEFEVELEEGLTNRQALGRISAAVRDAGIGIEASVVRVADEVWIVLGGMTGGSTGAIESVTDTSGDLMARLGLAGTPGEGNDAPGTIQEPQVASFVLDGLALEADTNVLEEILPGLSLTLRAPTSGPVEIEIASDAEAFRSRMESFVTAYNELVDALAEATRPGGEASERGLLRDSLGAVQLGRNLRGSLVVSGRGKEGLELRHLGLGIDRTGRLVWEDGGALEATVAGRAAQLDAGAIASGVLGRLREAIDPFQGIAGILSREEEALSRRLRSLEDRVRDTEARLDRREELLRQEIADLQAVIARIQIQQAALGISASSVSGSLF